MTHSRPIHLFVFFAVCLFVFTLCLPCPSYAQEDWIRQGTRIIGVTTLKDSGPGSLRQAIKSCENCVIVFEVGGRIDLQSPLKIENPGTYIAGETAPAPGIVLYGDGVHIRASNVKLSHLSIYAGKATGKQKAGEKDALSVFGSSKLTRPLSNIVIRNVSAGWGVDENMSVQGKVDGVRIERSLIAHGLRAGGHPKGVHSMNLLLGSDVRHVDIIGSVLAASEQRSPRLVSGNTVSFINNIVAMPGAAATHLDIGQNTKQSGAIDVIGNLYIAGKRTYCKHPAVSIAPGFFEVAPITTVYLHDNTFNNDAKPECLKPAPSHPALSHKRLLEVKGWTTIRSSQLIYKVLPYAGSFAAARNPVDSQLMQGIEAGTLNMIESEGDIGGMPAMEEKRHALSIPNGNRYIRNKRDADALKRWLCDLDVKASGLRSCR